MKTLVDVFDFHLAAFRAATLRAAGWRAMRDRTANAVRADRFAACMSAALEEATQHRDAALAIQAFLPEPTEPTTATAIVLHA